MSEFEFSTLIMVVALLTCLGAYSYWQIARAQRLQRKSLDNQNTAYLNELEDDTYSNTNIITNKSSVIETAPVASEKYKYDPANLQQGKVEYIAPTKSLSVPVVEPQSTVEKVETEVPTEYWVSLEKLNGGEAPNSAEKRDLADFFLDTKADVELSPEPAEPEEAETVWAVDEIQPHIHNDLLVAQEIVPSQDPQFFNQEDLKDQATLSVFEPLIRFSSWVESTHPAPIYAIDGVLDLITSQPKNTQDIERALYDLRLDTDLALRLYGLRAGQVEAIHSDDPSAARLWQPLEAGTLYSGLRLTLQLANASTYASTQLIHDWFDLGERLAKRLAAHVNAWPDPAALASYAVYLHDLSKRLGAPLIAQLRKPQGLWAGYEVHQQMTQWGLLLDDNGQYVARHANGRVLYRVLNDINNPRAQDFYRDALATMHVHTLSFCLDLTRVEADLLPSERLWHDMSQLAFALQAQWCNGIGNEISPEQLFAHAAEHVSAYTEQLATLAVPAGSITMKRLLQTTQAYI